MKQQDGSYSLDYSTQTVRVVVLVVILAERWTWHHLWRLLAVARASRSRLPALEETWFSQMAALRLSEGSNVEICGVVTIRVVVLRNSVAETPRDDVHRTRAEVHS